MIHRQLSEASRRRLQWLASGIAVVALTAASAGVAAADNYG